MTWMAYRSPGDINGVNRPDRIVIAVLRGDLDAVRGVVPLARRFLPAEVDLTLDEIDTVFMAMEPLAGSLIAVMGAEHPLTLAAAAAVSSRPETTVAVWQHVATLSDLTLATLQAAASPDE